MKMKMIAIDDIKKGEAMKMKMIDSIDDIKPRVKL